MITEGVISYLKRPHVGALMISGPWGSGKSYFVKNQLLDSIKSVEYKNNDSNNTKFVSERIRLILKDLENDKISRYFPIFVSVFGKNSIVDLEKAIVKEWIDTISNGLSSKIGKLKGLVKNLADKSEKLNEWFDVSSLLDYTPGIEALTLNTVIILDDLERFSESIKETDILGFINNLSENLGFKVIVIANEEFLKEGHKEHLVFKEKVVEKTLMYKPDSLAIIDNIIAGLKDAPFTAYMSDAGIRDSLNVSSAFSLRNVSYQNSLTNLRTLKFAIHHFHQVFADFVKYAAEEDTNISEYREILIHCWFSILALSIELKSNHISCMDARTLDDFRYLDSGHFVFGNSDEGDIEDLFSDTTDEEKDRNKALAEKEEKDRKYARWFYQFYFMSRSCGLYPLPSPLLIDYVVRGIDCNASQLIEEYSRKKDEYMPQGNPADEELSKLMQRLGLMTNDEVATSVNNLFDYARNGSFDHLTGFIQASVYLFGFEQLILDYDITAIKGGIFNGVDFWISNHELSDYERSQVMALSHSDNGALTNEVQQYIKDAIKSKDAADNANFTTELMTTFTSDIHKFCAIVCPQGFKAQQSHAVTYPMTNPILNQIPEDQIRHKLANIEVRDVSCLDALLMNRYSQIGVSDLKANELHFWEIVYDGITGFNPIDTAGKIMSQKQFKTNLTKFLGK